MITSNYLNSESHLPRFDYHFERYSDRLKVLLPAVHLVRLGRAELEEVAGSFRLPHKVERLPVVLEDGPVRIVLASGCRSPTTRA